MINPGSIILIFIILFLIVNGTTSKKTYINLFTLTVFVELAIERGYFIQIGTQLIAYRTICEGILALFSFFMFFKKDVRVNKVLAKRFGLVFFSLIIGWISLLVFPSKATGATGKVTWDMILNGYSSRQSIVFNESMIIEIIQVLAYIFIAFAAYNFLEKQDWIRILKNIVIASRFIVYLGIVELIISNVLKSSLFYDIANSILGVSYATQLTLRQRANGFALCGLTRESSHYVFILSMVLIINFAYHKYLVDETRDKCYFFTQSLCIILMIYSLAFSTLYFAACLALLAICLVAGKKGHSSIKLLLIFIAMGVGLVLIIRLLPFIASKLGKSNYFGERLSSVYEEFGLILNGKWLVASTAINWSNRVRIGSTYETFKLLLYRPLFGFGFASVSAHSSLAMLVSGMGILGTILYLRFVFFGKRIKICNYNNSTYLACIIIVFVLMNILNSMQLRPFYEVWNLLIVVALQSISVNSRKHTSKHHRNTIV